MRTQAASESEQAWIMDLQGNLLSLAKPGETIRFRWSRANPDEKYSLTLEGLGTDQASGKALGMRIGAFLSLLYEQGIDFNLAPSAPIEGKAVKGRHWLRITPGSRDFATDSKGTIGFRRPEDTRSPSIRFPALQARTAPDLTEYPMDLLAPVPGVFGVSLSFTRHELSTQGEQVLAKSLRLPFSDVLVVADAQRGHPALHRFMALWLSRRTGWRLELLAEVATDGPSPEVPLALLGREWFDTDCQVFPAVLPAKSNEQVLDFSSHYPDGWVFPPFFPTEYASDRLQVEARLNTRVPELPKAGVSIGIVNSRDVRMPLESRDLHTYVLGGTGTGKSTLLKRLIRHDMEAGESLVVLDPHGDLFQDVLQLVPEARKKDVVVLDPGTEAIPPGFNILNIPRDRFFTLQADFITGELIHFFKENWGDNPEAFGPIFELYFRNTLLLMIHQTQGQLSLSDFERVLIDRDYRDQLIETCSVEAIRRFWKELADKIRGDGGVTEIAPYITSKVSPLVQISYLAKMLGHEKDELDLGGLMQRKGILLVNLNKGLLGHMGSRLLGNLLATQLFAAGLRRSQIPRGERQAVNVYIDEFQNFVSPTLAEIFSEARKFGLRLHVANQTLGQLTQRKHNIMHSVLGNVGNQIFFRIGVMDTEALAPFFAPVSRSEMQELPNYHALVRLMTPAGPLRPFMMKTVL